MLLLLGGEGLPVAGELASPDDAAGQSGDDDAGACSSSRRRLPMTFRWEVRLRLGSMP